MSNNNSPLATRSLYLILFLLYLLKSLTLFYLFYFFSYLLSFFLCVFLQGEVVEFIDDLLDEQPKPPLGSVVKH